MRERGEREGEKGICFCISLRYFAWDSLSCLGSVLCQEGRLTLPELIFLLPVFLSSFIQKCVLLVLPRPSPFILFQAKIFLFLNIATYVMHMSVCLHGSMYFKPPVFYVCLEASEFLFFLKALALIRSIAVDLISFLFILVLSF